MKFAINLFLLFACLQAKAETVLRFQTQITPHAKHLGDLLQITPDKKQWSKIKLDSHPLNGAIINRHQVVDWMQHQVGIFSYQWQGKNTALVRQITKTKAQELARKAQAALEKQLKKQAYSSVVITQKSQLQDSDIPLTNFTVKIPQNYPIAKRVCVRLNYKKRTIPIWFSVKAYQSVLVAQQLIKRHSLVQKKDVVLKKQNIAGLPYAPLTKLPKTAWIKQSINKNQILTQGDLSHQPEVMQGEKVSVTVHQKGISIVAEALAQSDGYLGQVIRMKNPQTNKYFAATITGKNQAEIAA